MGLMRTLSSQVLMASRDGDPTGSLGNLLQYFATLTVENTHAGSHPNTEKEIHSSSCSYLKIKSTGMGTFFLSSL